MAETNSVHGVMIRKSHPALYKAIMTTALMCVALSFNFWFSTPTFNPYGIPKNIVGLIFFVLGASQVVFLNWFHELRLVRLVQTATFVFMLIWGVSNAEQWVNGKSSLQLPILFVAFAFLQIPLLTESPVNPMTEKK